MKKNSGFSLVELMVVVLIIAVLGQIASVTFASFKIRAYQVEAKQNLSFAGTLLISRLAEKNEYLGINLLLTQNDLSYYDAPSDNPNVANVLGFAVQGEPTKIRYSYRLNSSATLENHQIWAVELHNLATDERRVAPGCTPLINSGGCMIPWEGLSMACVVGEIAGYTLDAHAIISVDGVDFKFQDTPQTALYCQGLFTI